MPADPIHVAPLRPLVIERFDHRIEGLGERLVARRGRRSAAGRRLDRFGLGVRAGQPRDTRLMELVLVRHAMPKAVATQSPTRWPLTAEGCAAAGALRQALPQDVAWLSSPELKAVQTLQCAAHSADREIQLDGRLGEVRRPGEPFDQETAERRRVWVEGSTDERHAGMGGHE